VLFFAITIVKMSVHRGRCERGHRDARPRQNRKVALIAAGGALAMLGLGYASVPLYRLFCQATGLAAPRSGHRRAGRSVKVTARPVRVRFDANVASGMPWQFRPEQVTQDGRIGERKMAFFIAKNTSAHRSSGGHVQRHARTDGAYFHKIQCFCFNEQRLEPGRKCGCR
jgi:cytochrome c oxidase assembly protein subunit 11